MIQAARSSKMIPVDQVDADIQIKIGEGHDPSTVLGLLWADRRIPRMRATGPEPTRQPFLFLLGMIVVSCMPRTVLGTSIAFVWTPTGLMVVADSKMGGDSCREFDSVCKIERIGSFYAAYAGPTIIRSLGEQWFDGRDTVRSAFRPWRSLRQSRDALELAMSRSLPELAAHYRSAGIIPREDAQSWMNDHVSISALLFGIEDSTLRLFQTQMWSTVQPDGKVTVKPTDDPNGRFECPGPECGPRKQGIVGRTNAVMAHIAANPEFWDEQPTATVAPAWVQMEIDSPTDGCWVGGPMDILFITPDHGPCWMQRKCLCEQEIPSCAPSMIRNFQKLISGIVPPSQCPTATSLEATPSKQLNILWWYEQEYRKQTGD